MGQQPAFNQQQRFAPQQFTDQPQPQQQIPLDQLTVEDIQLHGFSRDDNQDGEIDPLPAHLQVAFSQQPAFQQQQQFAPQQQQQFAPRQQQFAPQQQQFASQQQQLRQPPAFRTPAPVAPSPAGQAGRAGAQVPQLTQGQL